MAYWKTGYRRIDGRRRKVRKLVRNGKVALVRVSGTKNYTDRTARKMGLKRKAGYTNNPKANMRKNY